MLTSQIISAIKRSFTRSDFCKKIREKNVVKEKKGPKGGKVVKCSVCEVHFPMYKSQIDHIDPVVPIIIPSKYMSFTMLYNRTFCKASNLQVICNDCHEKKSNKERKQRVVWRKKYKYIVIRHTLGCDLKVLKIKDMKTFNEDYEILAAYKTKKGAVNYLKKIRRNYDG